MGEITKEVAKQIAKPVYKDTLQPLAKEIGKGLQTVGKSVNTALMPVRLMVYGIDIIEENFLKRMEAKLKNVDPEKIVIPPLNIAGPLLEKYKYSCNNFELSEMFLNLLANSMNIEMVKKTHPSFVNVISELSSDEARLIKYFSNQEALPKLDVKAVATVGGGEKMIFQNFSLFGKKANLQFQDMTPQYLSNLKRLGIISYTEEGFGESYVKKEYYDELKNDPTLKLLEISVGEGYQMKTNEGIVKITAFGEMFMEAVL